MFPSLLLHRNSIIDAFGTDSHRISARLTVTFIKIKFKILWSITRTIVAMANANRTEVSTGIQSANEPITTRATNEIGGGNSIQSTKYKSKTENGFAQRGSQVTSEPAQADHWTENEFQQLLFQLNYYYDYYSTHTHNKPTHSTVLTNKEERWLINNVNLVIFIINFKLLYYIIYHWDKYWTKKKEKKNGKTHLFYWWSYGNIWIWCA